MIVKEQHWFSIETCMEGRRQVYNNGLIYSKLVLLFYKPLSDVGRWYRVPQVYVVVRGNRTNATQQQPWERTGEQIKRLDRRAIICISHITCCSTLWNIVSEWRDSRATDCQVKRDVALWAPGAGDRESLFLLNHPLTNSLLPQLTSAPRLRPISKPLPWFCIEEQCRYWNKCVEE